MKKTFVFFLLFLCFTLSLSAQESTSNKKSQFGISIGLKAFNEGFKTNDFASVGLFDELEKVESQLEPGFSLGILYQYHLNYLLAVRAQGELTFSENSILYTMTNEPNITRSREMVRIDVPVQFIIENSEKKVSPSFILGGKYSYDIARGEESRGTNFRQDDFLLEVGVGMAFTFKHFKMKPEIIYSRGLINQVSGESNQALDNVLDKVYSNQYSIRFVFYN